MLPYPNPGSSTTVSPLEVSPYRRGKTKLRRLARTAFGIVLSLFVAAFSTATSSSGVETPRLRVVSKDGFLYFDVQAPPDAARLVLRIRSSRNNPVVRFSDVSPLQPASFAGPVPAGGEIWYPVIDVELDTDMAAVAEFSDLPAGEISAAWNGWTTRTSFPLSSTLRFSADRLLQWENSLWVDQAGPRMTDFYLLLPLPATRSPRSIRCLDPAWSGSVELLCNEGLPELRSLAVAEVAHVSPEITRPASSASPLEPQRLREALAGAVAYTLRSQVRDPSDPMRGGLYVFYDLDAGCFRSSHWVWAWGPSAGLLLEVRKFPGLVPAVSADALLRVATEIGDAALRTVAHAPDHPARGMPVSRWDRSPRFGGGYECAFTPCDAAFLAAWTWVRLDEATGDPKWRAASEELVTSLERLMQEFPVPPQNYWPDKSAWDLRVIDEAGFGVELFTEQFRLTGDSRLRDLGRKYMDQHLAVLGRSDGLWDRVHFFDGRPNIQTIRMTRGLGWPMEGLLAAHRLMPEGNRYLDLARRMAEHLMAAQAQEGWWAHRFDRPVEQWGIGTKGTALWCWLLYELHRYTGDPVHLDAARRALAWLVEQQYPGPDTNAAGGHVAVSPHSAVGYRPWFRVTSSYGSAFFGLALLEELRLQHALPQRRVP